jgi:hypothetical protein
MTKKVREIYRKNQNSREYGQNFRQNDQNNGEYGLESSKRSRRWSESFLRSEGLLRAAKTMLPGNLEVTSKLEVARKAEGGKEKLKMTRKTEGVRKA